MASSVMEILTCPSHPIGWGLMLNPWHAEYILTHWGRVTHICFSKFGHYWLRWWHVAWSVPSHYPNHCWNIIDLNLRNKLHWKPKWNSYIFIQENAFQHVVWKMAAILSQPQCVKKCKNMFASYIFVQENAFENVICEMATIYFGLSVLIKCKNMFASSLNTEMVPILKDICHWRLVLVYSVYLIQWLVTIWQQGHHKKQGHHQPWYWQVPEYSSFSTRFNAVWTGQNGRHFQMFLANFGISILILQKCF